MIQSVNLPPSAHPVYTLQQSLHLQCTLQPCTAMYSYLQPTFSAHCSQLQPSTTIYTAAILSSAHCSYTIQCTLQLFYPVHTAAILSSAYCSYTIQCILQLYYPVHTAAILSSAHCSYTIQCILQLYYPVHTAAIPSSAHTVQLHYLVQILYSTFSAPLNHHKVSLYHYWPTSRTVSRH